MSPIFVLLFGFSLIMMVFACSQWLDGRRGNAVVIFISGALVVSAISGLSYAYLYRWSQASIKQKQTLADLLPRCPEARAGAEGEIKRGLSSGMAERLIADCAQERLEVSASE